MIPSMNDEAAYLREALRLRAAAEKLTGHKWDTKDTVTRLILSARLAALSEKDRDKPEPSGW